MPHTEEKSNLPQRKLTTILAADVVGYSRMMGVDEDGTHKLLGKCRKIIDRNIDQHGGRIFNTAGDSVMAEFGSTVEAVRCALEIQEEIVAHNTDKPESEKMWFRIGLNVGDVIIEGEDLIGDGVNIAARMESIASPGGICISGSVYELVRNKLSYAFEDMGKQSVKNIVEPVSAYSLQPTATPKIAAGTAGRAPQSEKKMRFGVLVGIAVVIVVGGVIASTYFAGKDLEQERSATRLDKGISSDSISGSVTVKGSAEMQQKTPVQPRGAKPTLHRHPPSYFAEKVAEGVNRKTGERFEIEMAEQSGATATFYKKAASNEPRIKDTGRWWINKQDRICFEFNKIHKGKKFCLIHEIEEGREWLASGDPSKPKWVLRPR